MIVTLIVIIALFAWWGFLAWVDSCPECELCGKPACRELGDCWLCDACHKRIMEAHDRIAALGLTPEQLRTVLQQEEPWQR